MKLTCFECKSPVSTEVPDDTVVRAIIQCFVCSRLETARLKNIVRSFELDLDKAMTIAKELRDGIQ